MRHPMPERKIDTLETLDEALRRRTEGMPPWAWFDHRVKGHMEANAALPRQPLSPNAVAPALQEQLSQPARLPRAIYIHIPFCTRLCSFCGFFRRAAIADQLEPYTRAVAAQIKRLAESRWSQNGPHFSAVYFGGGTPTALSTDQLCRLVAAIRDRYPLAADCEFTIECRFEGLEGDTLKRLRKAGANRLSFGVQSFDTDVRRGVGRLADYDQMVATLDAARDVGFDRISVDLIYNLPGQTRDTWARTLDRLRASPATAASVYTLLLMPNSSLAKQIESGVAPPLGSIADEFAFFRTAFDALIHRRGWSRMSFHHFGDASSESNTYNQVRSGGMDTLGLGSGAGGRIGDVIYMNLMSIPGYIDAQSSPSHQGMMFASRQSEEVTRAATAYRLTEADGIHVDELLELIPGFEPALQRFVNLDLVYREHGRLTLSREGCFWGYNITKMVTGAIAEALGSVEERAEAETSLPRSSASDGVHAQLDEPNLPLAQSHQRTCHRAGDHPVAILEGNAACR
jgi:oxygen-independent coproporphyrinogen-3 oxidase